MRIQIAFLTCALALPASATTVPSKADLTRAHAGIARMLRDPDSAKYTNAFAERGVVCGAVNSKNRMGGYAGPTLYIYDLAADRAFILDDAAEADQRQVTLDRIKRGCKV